MYYSPEANIKNAQLIVSQVGASTNWKMCVETSLDAEAKVGKKKGKTDPFYHLIYQHFKICSLVCAVFKKNHYHFLVVGTRHMGR